MRTRQALHTALLTLLAEQPFEQITIRQITARAGIGYATFFRHHASPQALLSDLAAKEIDRLVERAVRTLDRTHDTHESCLALAGYVLANRATWTALLTGGAAAAMRDAFIRASRRVASDGPATTEWLPLDLGVIHASSAIVVILAWWLRQPEMLPADDVATIIDRLVVAPLGVR